MKKEYVISVIMAVFFLAAFTTDVSAMVFKVEITNLSPNALSPTALVTHDSGYDLFDLGAPVSSGVEAIAETGNNSIVLTDASLSGSVMDYQGAAGGPIFQDDSYTMFIEADLSHPILTYMSMVGVSNDAFIEGSTDDGAIYLFSGFSPLAGDYFIMPQDVWDAGTEVNDELAVSVGALGAGPMDGVIENDVITIDHQGILGVGDIPLGFNWTDGPVAEIKVTPTPVPPALLLLGSGLLGILGIGKRRSNRQ